MKELIKYSELPKRQFVKETGTDVKFSLNLEHEILGYDMAETCSRRVTSMTARFVKWF